MTRRTRDRLKRAVAGIADYPAPVRLLLFVLALFLVWLPLGAGVGLGIPNANTANIVAMALLFAVFLVLVPLWGQSVHNQPRLLQVYGLVWSRRNGVDWVNGFALGALSLLALFGIEGWLGWVMWQAPTQLWNRLLFEAALVGGGVGLAEELLFRGWLLDELQRDYRPTTCLWSSSLIFASLHFIKPLPEMLRTFPAFPGLLLLGLTLVWAKWSTRDRLHPDGRLGLPIGLHSGLVGCSYILHVGGLVSYANRVPDWVTGIDRNPLAGLMGLLFLGALALWMWRRSQTKFSQP